MKYLRFAVMLSIHGCYFNPEIKSAPFTTAMLVTVWLTFESFRLLKKTWKNQLKETI